MREGISIKKVIRTTKTVDEGRTRKNRVRGWNGSSWDQKSLKIIKNKNKKKTVNNSWIRYDPGYNLLNIHNRYVISLVVSFIFDNIGRENEISILLTWKGF